MKLVEPQVHLIAETIINNTGMYEYLKSINANNYSLCGSTDVESLIEVAGKTCYMSFDTELNNNLTHVRKDDNYNYIGNLLKVGHESVLEHGSVTLAFVNVSRIFTHELVRHRAGCAYSQVSGRYVRTNELEAYNPMCFNKEETEQFSQALSQIELLYQDLETKCFKRLDFEDKHDFTSKKEITSALRRLLPNGQSNTIIMTANHRALRHIIKMRTSDHAEEEIRIVFRQVQKLMQKRYNSIYQDIKPFEE
jgi:thymidylate synthase (FAD)